MLNPDLGLPAKLRSFALIAGGGNQLDGLLDFLHHLG
jgi:hypothetical protein